MAKLFQLQMVHPYFTNLPKDVIVNTMHMTGPDGWSADDVAMYVQEDVQTLLNSIYTNITANKVPWVDWTKSVLKVYDTSEAPPRVPGIRPIPTVVGTATTPMPTEVALVATFRAAPVPGVIYQRLYNRWYLGGVPSVWFVNGAADEFPRFLPAVLTRINDAFKVFHEKYNGNEFQPNWVQLSEAGGVSTARPIVGGWADDSPDTQRRRGVNATQRITWDAD